jgi:cytochrome c oxidase cbb3-type subunit 3
MNSRVALLVPAALGLLLLSGCRKTAPTMAAADPSASAYDTEADWNDGTKTIRLGYQEAQGKRIFYQYCVWCHADATPAGPSNRSNLTPVPPLLYDGDKLNGETDDFLQSIITKGGAAVNRSPMMPPYGNTLSADQVKAVVAFARVIAQPAYTKTPPKGNAASK